MKVPLRLYDGYDGEVELLLLELRIDDRAVNFDSTEDRVLAIEDFHDDAEQLTLSVEARSPTPLEPNDQVELLLECRRTRLRTTVILSDSMDQTTWNREIKLPAGLVEGKLLLTSRIVRPHVNDFLEVGSGPPVEIVFEQARPPGGQGFITTKYIAFDEPNSPINEAFHKQLFYVDLGSTSINPTVYINTNYETARMVFEYPLAMSDRGKFARLSQIWIRNSVLSFLAMHTIRAFLLGFQDDWTEDDIETYAVPEWTKRFLRVLATAAERNGLTVSGQSGLLHSFLVAARADQGSANFACLAGKVWSSGDQLGSALTTASRAHFV